MSDGRGVDRAARRQACERQELADLGLPDDGDHRLAGTAGAFRAASLDPSLSTPPLTSPSADP
jgi:hypothetical protein